MPGIANKYFRIHRRAPSVGGMTCAPYALDVFRPWIPLAGLDVRCPVSPGQILQCGANYRLIEGEITGLGTQRNHCVSERRGRKSAPPAQLARPAEPSPVARRLARYPR